MTNGLQVSDSYDDASATNGRKVRKEKDSDWFSLCDQMRVKSI